MENEGPGSVRIVAGFVGRLFGWVAALIYGGATGYTIYHGPILGELTQQNAIIAAISLGLCLFYLPPLWRGLEDQSGLLKVIRYLLGSLRFALAPLLVVLIWGIYERGPPEIDDGIAYGARGCPNDAKPRGAAPPVGDEIWCDKRGGGLRHGPYAAWYDDGEPRIDGFYEDGERHGTWTHWYVNGQVKERSDYQRGKRHGEWSEWYSDGAQATQGTFVDGGLDGRVRRWHPNGELYVDARYDHGRPPFEWLEFFPDGTPAGKASITLVAELPAEWRRAVCHEDPARIVRDGYQFAYSRVGRTESFEATGVRKDPITGALVVEVEASKDWAPAHVFLRLLPGRWQISEPFAPYPLRPWVEADQLEDYRREECGDSAH